jgi:hypothetical protein
MLLPALSCPALPCPACRDLKWIQKHVVPAKQYNSPNFNSSALGVQVSPAQRSVPCIDGQAGRTL